MFLTEIVAGTIAGSVSLQTDALDFLGDSFNYAISLAVIGFGLTWRARVALFKGLTMAALGLWVLAAAALHVAVGRMPEPLVMGVVGSLALLATRRSHSYFSAFEAPNRTSGPPGFVLGTMFSVILLYCSQPWAFSGPDPFGRISPWLQ